MPRTASAATARTNITLRILLPGLHLRSHQTDFIDPGAESGVDRLGYPLEVYGRVALDEDHALGARLKDLLETAAQMGVIGSLAVDGQVVRGINRDDHGTLVRLVRLLVWRRRLPRWASSVASLLMARLCAASIVMTTVRWSDWFAFWFGGGGCPDGRHR